jgi:hypothetical protein
MPPGGHQPQPLHNAGCIAVVAALHHQAIGDPHLAAVEGLHPSPGGGEVAETGNQRVRLCAAIDELHDGPVALHDQVAHDAFGFGQVYLGEVHSATLPMPAAVSSSEPNRCKADVPRALR